jgi:hypothetical protein
MPPTFGLPYSPECVEGEFSELRLFTILGSSPGKFQRSPIWGTETGESHALGELDEGNSPRQVRLTC